MRPLDFTPSFDGDVHRFVHAPGDARVVERNNWPVLMGDWPATQDTPYLRFAVNNNNAEEIAVYLGLVWQLTSELHRWAIPAYCWDGAARLLRQEPRFVAWEYEVDATREEPSARQVGFVPARSAAQIPASAFERDHRAQAGLFAVNGFDDLVSLTLATLGDAEAEVTLFALTDPDAVDRLVQRLRGRRAPHLTDLLEPGDRFVDLTIGVDLGHWDSLIIASRDDISEEVAALARLFERAVDRYERHVDETSTVEAILAELSRLAAGES